MLPDLNARNRWIFSTIVSVLMSPPLEDTRTRFRIPTNLKITPTSATSIPMTVAPAVMHKASMHACHTVLF